jgi:hypothetical protein
MNFLGRPGVQSSATLTIFNSSDINVYFKVQTTHATHYAVKPNAGIVKALELQTIQITSNKLNSDYEKHKFIILSAVQHTNVDVVTFWRTVKPENYASKKLTVNVISTETDVYSSNGQTFNKQQLELHICQAVRDGQSLSVTIEQLFLNINTVPKAIKQFVKNKYTEYLIEVLKYNFKAAVLNMIQRG